MPDVIGALPDSDFMSKARWHWLKNTRSDLLPRADNGAED
jgi:hypothetical protein